MDQNSGLFKVNSFHNKIFNGVTLETLTKI